MAKRRIIIGAIGGDRQLAAASGFGTAVVRAGCILLTGGRPVSSDHLKDAAMDAAASAETEGSPARLVGILPSHELAWDESRSHRLMLWTGLPHNYRNVINALTPDVLVVFGGSRGTLAETAFALFAGKAVFPASDAAGEVGSRLKRNFETYFKDRNRSDHGVRTYLCDPAEFYKASWSRPPVLADLTKLLSDFLVHATESRNVHERIVEACLDAVPAAACEAETGFPGLPGNPGAKRRFEDSIIRISR